MSVYKHGQVRTKNGEVKVGWLYDYYEAGYVFRVRVLADESDEERIQFKLQRFIKVDGLKGLRRADEEPFTCMAARGLYAYSGMWRLYDKGTYRNVS